MPIGIRDMSCILAFGAVCPAKGKQPFGIPDDSFSSRLP